MVTWSSTALVLLQSKYSFALAHAAPLSLSLSVLHSTAHAEFQVNQIDSSTKSSPWSLECGWSKLTDGFGSLSLIVISSFRSYHTLESLSLSVTHTHLKVFRTFVKWKIDFSCLATCNFGMQMAERKTATNAATAADTDTQIQIQIHL